LNQWKKRKTFYKSNHYEITDIRDNPYEKPSASIDDKDFLGFGKCIISFKKK
jgi:hypothetical protein